jgi:NADH:ubiquinone oxidoreductase subunit 6 (subunit J)
MTESLPLAASWVEPAMFLLLAGVAVLSALVAAFAPKVFFAVVGLLGAFVAVAGLYALLGADFVAVAQLLVYVGGILVLLVFAVLLTGRVLGRVGLEPPPSVILPSLVGGLVFFGLAITIRSTSWITPTALPEPEPTTAALGRALLDPERYLLPFELASVLLLAALVGAAYLVRRRRDG